MTAATPPSVDPRVWRYHERTKHRFDRLAPSLGYLDWETQPSPFRRFRDAPRLKLPHRGPAAGVSFDDLARPSRRPAEPLTLESVGDFLRHSLGLSAWKQLGTARWSLRVDPSSGNLHPTECHLLLGPEVTGGGAATLWHYDPEHHALEARCRFDPAAWEAFAKVAPRRSFLVCLSSVTWREAWKYGERAFRYCQHDTGHCLAALAFGASLLGWRSSLLPRWPAVDLDALLGLDRAGDYREGERDEAELIALVHPAGDPSASALAPHGGLLAGVRAGRWSGPAEPLSSGHVDWPAIDEVAAATRSRGEDLGDRAPPAPQDWPPLLPPRTVDARRLILRRRSCLALDGRSSLPREDFTRILASTLPRPGVPWDSVPWRPCIHLAIFVHRVVGLAPGLYLLVREPTAAEALREAVAAELAWERPRDLPAWLPVRRLAEGDFRQAAMRLSCDQDIAADGFFSLGMVAELESPVARLGPAFYRNLFWEAGVIGQVLYLEVEAAGARGTGIGCFMDDAVHGLLGLRGRAFQSLYHFTAGRPVDDPRLTTLPAYADEDGT